ncbi:MAG TPA: RNA polymerase sigma factor, partial [Solirubrobacterales bacterium]|nr:RNA polymerase sigma factor [Solirubrobacterales bacterium]
LYAEHARGLFAFLAYRTGDRSLAEEVLAEAFEKALRARGGFDPRRAAAKTWLYAIALNCLRDRRRRGEAESRALDRLGADSARAPHADEIGRIEERDALARALSTLSAEEREAIALRYGGALTVPEISRLLDEKLTTVEGRVYRALGKLRAELS